MKYIVKVVILQVIILPLFFISNALGECDDYVSYMSNAYSYASDAYRFAKKAYRNYDDEHYVEKYSKKAYRNAEDAYYAAQSAYVAADECNCNDGATFALVVSSYADEAYRYAKKAYRNYDDEYYAEKYSKKAYRNAEDAESTASLALGICD
jgi:hypothetical protein